MPFAFKLTVALIAAIAWLPSAFSQTWPAKPIRIIVAAAPGVPTDTIARGLVEPLGRTLGQPIIVENRIGADGIIGTEACAKAAPDGYALCGTASNVIIWNSVLRAKLPYDSVRDFAPVVHVGFFDSALLVHPSLPVHTVQQLVDYAKANPGKVNWGHFGVNSTGYMYQEWIKRSRNAPFYPVPYKTQPQAYQALLANETHVGVNSIATMTPFLKAGKARALAVTASKRISWMPNVPTFEEEGIKLPLRTWFGYHYPIAVPRELVARMNRDLRKLMEQPDFRTNILERIGLTTNFGTPEEFDAFIRNQIKEVAELVAFIGIKPE